MYTLSFLHINIRLNGTNFLTRINDTFKYSPFDETNLRDRDRIYIVSNKAIILVTESHIRSLCNKQYKQINTFSY